MDWSQFTAIMAASFRCAEGGMLTPTVQGGALKPRHECTSSRKASRFSDLACSGQEGRRILTCWRCKGIGHTRRTYSHPQRGKNSNGSSSAPVASMELGLRSPGGVASNNPRVDVEAGSVQGGANLASGEAAERTAMPRSASVGVPAVQVPRSDPARTHGYASVNQSLPAPYEAEEACFSAGTSTCATNSAEGRRFVPVREDGDLPVAQTPSW